MAGLFIGRQPIFNRSLKVVGYELLYRSFKTEHAAITNQDHAIGQVILDTFLELGIEKLVGKSQAFINLTENFLIGKLPIPFPPERVVLEVAESVPMNQDMIKALRVLANAGFTIALDGVTSMDRVTMIVDIVRIVKIDVTNTTEEKLKTIIQLAHNHSIKALVEKVETMEAFHQCLRLGFDYFQGYFLCKPSLVKGGERIHSSRLIILHTLAMLFDPEADFRRLEDIINQDVRLSYKLLRLVKSAYYARMSTINSINQAITLIGLTQLRGWMTLILMSTVDNKPPELTTIAIQRAKMCEMLCRLLGKRGADTCFLVGLFSVLDAILDLSMDQLVVNVPISEEAVEALVKRTGTAGEILTTVIAFEQGDWKTVTKINLPPDEIQRIYIEALDWSSNLIKELERSLQGS